MQRRVTKHFTTEELVDFVNQQQSMEQMQKIQAHLATGCRSCSGLYEAWERIRGTARRESEFEAPQSAVRLVKSAFAMVAGSGKGKKETLFEIPRLVFDSLWQPALIGTRSNSRLPRQVLYRLGEIAMEMRLEPDLDSERINITGQISVGKQEDEDLGGIPVTLGSARGVVAKTSTNQFGEFQLKYLPEKDVRISFGTIKGRNVSVPLDAES